MKSAFWEKHVLTSVALKLSRLPVCYRRILNNYLLAHSVLKVFLKTQICIRKIYVVMCREPYPVLKCTASAWCGECSKGSVYNRSITLRKELPLALCGIECWGVRAAPVDTTAELENLGGLKTFFGGTRTTIVLDGQNVMARGDVPRHAATLNRNGQWKCVRLIELKYREGRGRCCRNLSSAQYSECQIEEVQLGASKKRE